MAWAARSSRVSPKAISSSPACSPPAPPNKDQTPIRLVAAVGSERVMPPVVQLKDVQKIYTSGEVKVHAVRGVSLDLQRGEFMAIMGASGSGKSTLMNT